MSSDELNHFKKADPILYSVIKKIGKLEVEKSFGEKDYLEREYPDFQIGNESRIKRESNFRGLHSKEVYFIHLVESIISQQLSGKASDTIFTRFKSQFKEKKITPATVLILNDEKIRSAGISYSKIKYIKDLSAKVYKREINLEELANLSDEGVILELIKVKGIGRWTAEMFLMFTLNRPDVFSHGDLGLKNAIKKIYFRSQNTVDYQSTCESESENILPRTKISARSCKLEANTEDFQALEVYKRKKYDIEEIEKIVSVWSPYKTYASRILWKSLDNR